MSNEPSKVTKQVFYPNYNTEGERSSSQMKIVERSSQITNYSLSSRRKDGECNVTYKLQYAYQYMLPISPTNTTWLHTHSQFSFISSYFTFCPSLSLIKLQTRSIHFIIVVYYSILFSHTFANLGPF